MVAKPLLQEIQRLSLDERIELVEAVWDQIADEANELPLSEAHRRLLDERLAAHARAPQDVIPWSQFRAELLGDD
jgi:putative addiction module component (TIGR02574 family)